MDYGLLDGLWIKMSKFFDNSFNTLRWNPLPGSFARIGNGGEQNLLFFEWNIYSRERKRKKKTKRKEFVPYLPVLSKIFQSGNLCCKKAKAMFFPTVRLAFRLRYPASYFRILINCGFAFTHSVFSCFQESFSCVQNQAL